MLRWLVCSLALSLAAPLMAQEGPVPPVSVPFGMREIDKLPRSQYARPLFGEPSWLWSAETEPQAPEVTVHTKASYRVGLRRMERLCVLEACLPDSVTQTGVLRFRGSDLRLDLPVHWLAPKAQYRARWLPVVAEPINVALEVGGRMVAHAEFSTDEDAPQGLFSVQAAQEPPYVDHGYGLLPASYLMVTPGTELALRFAAGPQAKGSAQVVAELVDRDGATVRSISRSVSQATQASSLSLDTSGLRIGTYGLRLKATLAKGTVVEDTRQVILVERSHEPGFGARYADLSYPAPVYVSRTDTLPWEALWKGNDLRDLVVSFDNSEARFVFWRGTSYVPCWAFNTSWLSYEWLEAEPDLNGAVDCVEPIMDKECRNSRAEIVSSTPARVVVHWRYGLTDFAQKVINDEWADEYYYLYPDAVGTRKLVAWYKSGWHENQEFLLLNRPGNAPQESVNPQALTLLTTDGRTQRPEWPRPFLSIDGWPHVIASVNLPTRLKPFMAVDDADVQVKLWAEPYVDKPGLFNTYLHWPISRGLRTTWLDSAADFQRPTHSNLANLVNAEAESSDDHRVWYWLIGVTSQERSLRQATACWLEPGTVKVAGGSFDRYDGSQRAYIVKAADRAGQISLTVTPSEAPVVNPAFVISGAGQWLSEAGCSQGAKRVALGRENDGRDLVVYVEGHFDAPFTVEIK